MKPTTLLIMAAGIGSRFGTGIKQLEPVGMNNEIIMDFSIHDAIKAGFNKIVFVIRPDIESDFKERIGDRVEEICGKLNVEVAYTFQDIHSIPGELPADRTKPWGTGQAVLSAKSLIHEPFAVINADDYYGKNAFKVMHDWLILDHAENAIAMAGFILKNTLSDHGGVTRGVCKVAEGHTHVIDVVETSNIVKTVDEDTGAVGAEADDVVLDPESYVSWIFRCGRTFLLNYKFDSISPMALVLVGQTELWDSKLQLQRYAAILQRIDMYCILPHLDRSETGQYIRSHLDYAGCPQELFTEKAVDEVHKASTGIPRMINRVCEKSLMYGFQQQKRLVDDHMVRFVVEHEMLKPPA